MPRQPIRPDPSATQPDRLTTTEPVPGYDQLNVHRVVALVREANDRLLDHILAYEEANRCRKTILAAIERRRDVVEDD